VQLPWSTSNEDLVELFNTIGKVERAEIQYEPSGRSRGTGVVQFDNAENAEIAIGELEFRKIDVEARNANLSSQPSSPDTCTVAAPWD
jgi:RNA recognition motif-containing protein